MEQWAILTERKLLRRQRANKLRKGLRRRCLAEFWDVWWYYIDLTERQRDKDAVAAQSSNAVKLLQGAVSRLTAAKAQGEKDRIQAPVPDPKDPCIASVVASISVVTSPDIPALFHLLHVSIFVSERLTKGHALPHGFLANGARDGCRWNHNRSILRGSTSSGLGTLFAGKSRL